MQGAEDVSEIILFHIEDGGQDSRLCDDYMVACGLVFAVDINTT